MNNLFILYSSNSIGVRQKCVAISDVFVSYGYASRRINCWTLFSMITSVLIGYNTLIWYRINYKSAIAVLPLLGILRLMRAKVIIEIPSPPETVEAELRSYGKKIQARLPKILCPLAYRLASVYVAYATDGNTFKDKAVILNNSLSHNEIEAKFVGEHDETFRGKMVGAIVAHLAEWHGVQVLMDAFFRASQKEGFDIQLKLIVIGGGPQFDSLSQLAKTINHQVGYTLVELTGPLTGENLSDALSRCNVGFGGLGYQSKGLSTASELKLRRYCAVGLPFVYFINDRSFDENTGPWLRSTAENLDLWETYQWLSSLGPREEVCNTLSKFALSNLTWDDQVSKVLAKL